MANSVFNLSDLNGTNGFTINSINSIFLGRSVSSAGDINSDGLDDLIIGAPNPNFNGIVAGKSYVVFGSQGSFDAIFDLSTLNGTNGFVINGINGNDNSGFSVSSAGDINGDGIDDLIIGAYFADPNGDASGQSYVVFGSKKDFDASFDLSTLNGTNGFAINGINTDDQSGRSVSSTGDINGDGLDDLIIGAQNASPNGFLSGQSYIVFGSKKNFGASFDLSTLNGTNGFTINGINSRDYLGFSVSSVGDINGDGLDDLIIGALGVSNRSGQSYVVFGSKGGFAANFDLSTLNGTNGFAINGIKEFDESGKSVSSAGDINGDGLDDLIIGASRASNIAEGQSYVVFGSRESFGASFDLSTLNGTNGFAINGISEFDYSGNSVSSAGDINGDGFDDLIIGTPYADSNGIFNSGQSYVVFGNKRSFDASFDLSTLNGSNGFVINGINEVDFSGRSVSSAGDINGDGLDDLIIGANQASDSSGQSYALFGNRAPILDLNGNSSGVDFSTTFSSTSVSILNRNFTLSDNNTTLAGATITITNLLNGTAESLNATAIGNITATYNATTGTLTLNGTDTIANYRKVLNSLTYNNTAASVNTTNRVIEFVVNDGQAFSNTSAVATTTLSFVDKFITGTLGTDILIGTPNNNIINEKAGNDKINGLSGNDLLRGGAGNDILIGGADNDTLVGGAGADKFLYNTNTAFASSAIGVDAIADFNHSQGDKIILDKTTFNAITSTPGTGFSNVNDFKINSLAATSTAKVVYDSVSGQLFYNPHGSTAGFSSSSLFATLTGAPTLTASNFVLQA
ncbi:FG-GAP repeat protein [Nostoc flagelliforme FACHB-838]|uniref:FG-GAP repeat protein n=1 Tax=Nostoc flagelliforme FACHB-838 TaxID=2692904 RepID=A0ABR8E1H6_9NOSO|nr:FG-GAP repeat protein [Nostoc flagelliforme]MBD2534957.1 FG-GAP repeat protein [Nostoc flagelliforme FACHB-838]